MKNKGVLFTFVRFGGLDLKNQDGYLSDELCAVSFHSPPAPRGFYAFPKLAQEFFLVSCISEYQPDVMAKKPKNLYSDDETTDEYLRKWRQSLRLLRREFYKDKGNVWHHLRKHVKHSDILGVNGEWVKTSVKVWSKAFIKESIECRDKGEKGKKYKSGMFGGYAKDHLEVFFDEKV